MYVIAEFSGDGSYENPLNIRVWAGSKRGWVTPSEGGYKRYTSKRRARRAFLTGSYPPNGCMHAVQEGVILGLRWSEVDPEFNDYWEKAGKEHAAQHAF